MLIAAANVQFSPSTFAPIAVGFFGLGTGYLIYFWQELAAGRLARKRSTWRPGSGASGCPGSCSCWPGRICSSVWHGSGASVRSRERHASSSLARR